MSTARIIGVTGATGLLGHAWIEHALEHDPELRVLALVRPATAAAPSRWLASLRPPHRERITLLAADFSSLWFSAEKLERLATVTGGWWHFAAVTRLGNTTEAGEAAMAVNARGTEQLLAAVRAITPGVPFFHVSTAYVAGCRKGTIHETPVGSEGTFHNPYERSKALAEAHVLRFFASGGRGAIFRPSLVLGSAMFGKGEQIPDLCANAILMALRQGEPEFHFRVSRETRLHLVSLGFVLRAFDTVARSDAPPRIYHLTPARDMRFADLQMAIEAAVPIAVKFSPGVPASELPDASRIFDRMIEEVRSYLTEDQIFDRANTEGMLPPELCGDCCDLPQLVARRLARGTPVKEPKRDPILLGI